MSRLLTQLKTFLAFSKTPCNMAEETQPAESEASPNTPLSQPLSDSTLSATEALSTSSSANQKSAPKSRKRKDPDIENSAKFDAAVKKAVAAELKAQKKRKQQEKESKFHCTDELLKWYESDEIYSKIDKLNTEAVKDICLENGLPRSGSKYKLKAMLIEHAKEAVKHNKVTLLQSEADADPSKAVELEFHKIKSFNAAVNFAKKKIAAIEKVTGLDEKLNVLAGLTRGFDMHLFAAITGPRAGFYNGKYGEQGEDAQIEICNAWVNFLRSFGNEMTFDEFMKFVDFGNFKTQTQPYGFDGYLKKVQHELLKEINGFGDDPLSKQKQDYFNDKVVKKERF
ncbi:hypothetical protein HK096_009323 [Nowakowskiella sp. JEL0078]|nr:hypothetical protein HK096_009323 [Nowakowskiella sp. JEL0078]